MPTTQSTQEVEEIRRRVHTAYTHLQQLIQDHLADLERTKLYQIPVPEEWTVMENLAHIIEFMPYWADEVAKLVAVPGQPFGRTKEHAGRLRGIEAHKNDELRQAAAILPGCYAHLDHVLHSLKDSDLSLTGLHPKYGEQKLEWFIDEFIAKHLEDHVDQIKRALAAVER